MKKFTRGKIDSFLEKYSSEANVLDIGASSGDHSNYYPHALTIDIDPSRKPDQVADAQELPFEDHSFDGIVCSEVLEHIPNPKKAIAEMRRVLVPGGFVVLTTRFLFPVHDAPGDYFRFTPYALEELFKDWDMREVASENGPFSTIAVLLQRILFQTDIRGGKATKAVLYLFAKFFSYLDALIVKSYGDIRRSSEVTTIMTSGVYIYCTSPRSN
jgi:SAM-dependent methyltransferase